MRTTAGPTIALLIGSTIAAPGFAGVYLENTHQDLGGEKQTPEVHKMWFDGGRFRAETPGKSVTIFKDQAFYVLSPKDKTYLTMDKAKMDQLGGQLADARRKMEAQLADMPPEQRAMMEKMMGQMMDKSGGGALAQATKKRTVSKTSRTEKAAGQTCTVWEVSVEGRKDQELCVVAPGALPGGAEMMKTMRELGEMFKGFAQNLPAGGGDAVREAWSDLETINGIPVITREFEGGKATSETRLSAVRNETPPAAAFEIPAGYKEKTMSFGGR